MTAAGTLHGFIREETSPIFTCGGVICDNMRYAAQVACLALGKFMEEVACRFGQCGLKFLLPLADRDPLGPPVGRILEVTLPFQFGFALLYSNEVRPQDGWGVRKAQREPSLGKAVCPFIATDAVVTRGEPNGQVACLILGQPGE